jgi:hypothetical protein
MSELMMTNKQQQLVEYAIQDIIRYQIEDNGLSIDEAMERLYSSETFSKLQDMDTRLYLAGSAYLYELFKDEISHGTLVQF